MTPEEHAMFRRYTYFWWLTFPTLLIFGLAHMVKRLISPLPKIIQYAIGWPFAAATALSNIFYNHTAAVIIFKKWPPKGELFFSSRLKHYEETNQHPKLRRHLMRMVQAFDPEHFDHIDDL